MAHSWEEHLERLMRGSGKSNIEIAADCGVHPNSVSAWRSGVRPRRAMLVRLAASLGVSEATLLSGEQPAVEGAAETVPEIVEDARRRIAAAMGVSADKIRLTLVYEA